MAGNLTRINNNQITDAISGNTYFGIDANTKIQAYSITSNLLANNFVYSSNLTVQGNLCVTGNVTAINTTNITIEDPLLLLASNQSGSPTVDIGYIGQRGTSNNIAFVWNESLTSFVTVYTSSGAGDNTTIAVLSYADLITGNANVSGNLTAVNVSLTGNVITPLNVTGNVTANNIAAIGTISATGNISANYYFGNGSQLTGIITQVSNISNGNSSANIGTPAGNMIVTIANTLVSTFYNNGVNFTGDISVTGNAAAGNVTIANALNGNTVSLSGNVTSALNVTGNIAANNIVATTNISAAGNITSNAALNGNTLSLSGNVTSALNVTGNVTANNVTVINALNGNTVSLSGNVVSALNVNGNIQTANYFIGDGSFISNINGANVSTTKINNGNSYANIATVNANLVVAIGANSNVVATFYDTGVNFAGPVSVNGNVTTNAAVNAANLSLSGNVTSALNVTGNVTANNVTVITNISAAGNITSNAALNGNTLSLSGNVTSALNVTDNVTANNISATNNISAAGNITSNAALNGNTLSLSGNVTSALNLSGNLVANFIGSASTISAQGNVYAANYVTTGSGGNISGVDVLFASTVTASGNVYGEYFISPDTTINGGVFTTGDISAAGDITSGGYFLGDGGLLSNINGANVSSTKISNGNSYANIASANANLVVAIGANANVVATFYDQGVSITGNVATSSAISAAGNITGNYILGNGSQLTGIITTVSNVINGTSNLNIASANANLTISVNNISNIAVFSTTGLSVVGNVSANGNVVGGNVLTVGLISSTGNINGANIRVAAIGIANNFINNLTSIVSSASNVTLTATSNFNQVVTGTSSQYILLPNATTLVQGTVYSFNNNSSQPLYICNNDGSLLFTVAAGGLTDAILLNNSTTNGTWDRHGFIPSYASWGSSSLAMGGANISGANNISTTGNITSSGAISATGNITTSGIVNTANIYGASGVTVTTGGNTNINLYPGGTGNLVLPSGNATYINNLALTPIQNGDAATKYYVDTMVSSGLAFHPPVYAATTANLATTTGGTITYNQPNGAGNGIGATITTTGSFNLIDTANVQTANTRILVKNEGNAVLNGVYVWNNASVITRSTDADEYGPDSVNQLSLNDYFFTTNGNVNAGTAFVVNSPSGNITFGTSNITFTLFSSSQTYTSGNGISIAGIVINAKVDGVTTAFDGGGNIIVKDSANLTTPNIGAATGTSLSTTGTITGNILTGVLLSATGNVTGGNIVTAGFVSATGNITADPTSYFIGNGSQLTGISSTAGTALTNGNTNVSTALDGNANITINGTSNVVVVTTAGVNVTGNVSANGNVIGGNITTAGFVSATGNVYSGNLINAGSSSVTGNLTAGNILTAGLISSTSNVISGNVLTGGIVSATGNIYAANFITGNGSGGNITGADLITANTVSATANIIGGNILTAGVISTSGNIYGNGRNISGTYVTSPSTDTGGDLNILLSSNISFTGAVVGTGTSGSTATINPGTGVIKVAGANIGGYGLSVNGGITAYNGGGFTGDISAAGNVSAAGNILATGVISATGNITANASSFFIGNGSQLTGVAATTATALTNGNTNVTTVLNGNANVTINGNSNVVVWASTGEYVTGEISASGNITGNYILGNGSQLTGIITSVSNVINGGSNLDIATANADVTISVSTVGNVAVFSPVGVSILGTVAANGDISGANVSASGNVSGNNVNVTTTLSAGGNVYAANFTTTGSQGNITGANIISAITITATGNVGAGSYLFGDGAYISNINAANVSSTKITNGGSYANIASSDGNLVIAVGANSNVAATFYDNGVIFAGNVSAPIIKNGSTGMYMDAGYPGYISFFNGNGNTVTIGDSGSISAVGNVISANVLTGGFVSAAGNVYTGNVSLSGNVYGVASNFEQPNFIQPASDDANWSYGVTTSPSGVWMQTQFNGGQPTHGVRIYDNYANTYPFVVDGDGNVTATTQLVTPSVTSSTSLLNIGTTGVTSVAVNGGSANLLFVNGSTNAVAVGSNVITTGATFAINATDSFLLPVGNTAQRPGSTATGMMRYNSTLSQCEVWNGTAWTSVGGTAFTVIQNEQFDGDGSTVAFTLGSSQTTVSCIVTINGVLQAPTTAYSVSGVYPTCVLTFTEAPVVGDTIDVREITTTTTVTAISNTSGNSLVAVQETKGEVDITGNLVAQLNAAAPSLTANSTMSFCLVNNTTLAILVRGTDGVTRTANITLS